MERTQKAECGRNQQGDASTRLDSTVYNFKEIKGQDQAEALEFSMRKNQCSSRVSKANCTGLERTGGEERRKALTLLSQVPELMSPVSDLVKKQDGRVCT